MTDKEALNLAIKYLRKRLSRIDKAIEEDNASVELIGEYIHYITEEGFNRAKKERKDLLEAIGKLIFLSSKEDEKPYKHICKNCYYYSEEDKTCLNCDSPSDIRKKEPEDICDGGGTGAENFGFTPCRQEKEKKEL